MYCRTAIIIATVLLYGNQVQPVSSQEKDGASQSAAFLDGLVSERKKYSFSIRGPEKEHEIKLNQMTTVAVRLIRPTFDFGNRTVVVSIPGSAPDGRAKNNLQVKYKLPEKIYFRSQFDSKSALESAMQKNPVELTSIVLSKKPLSSGVSDDNKPEWSGEFVPTNQAGIFETQLDGETRTLRAKMDTVAIEGFSIMDLEPGATEVFVNGSQNDDGFVAKRVEFVRLVDPKTIFDNNKKKCLLIGDTISFNYMPALIKALGDDVRLHHPNTNCQGTGSYRKIHRWVGLNEDSKFRWDVIAFNFGHSDVSLSKAEYQRNLKKCIDKLSQTGAELVWIESTPVPFGFNDPNLKVGETIPASKRFDFEFEESDAAKVLPGRMRTQNRWAKEVLKNYPAIEICEVFDVVKGNASRRYSDWWYGKSLNFRFPQSQPIAREIANSILKTIK